MLDAVTVTHVQIAVVGAAALSALLFARRAPLWAHLLAFAVALSVHAAYVAVYKDDAFITFRYAAQLLAGNGPNFNPGERVEGYTTPLWMLLSALVGRLGLEMPLAMRTAALAANLALMPLLVWFHAHALDDPADARAGSVRPDGLPSAFALIAPALVATNGALAFWAMGAMETALFTLLVTAGVAAACRAMLDLERRDWSPLVFVLAYFTRPEGALFLAVTQLARAVVVWRERPAALARPRAYALPLVAAVVIAAHVAWRWWYYGAPLPNTFYAVAAVTPDGWRRGLRYVERAYAMYFAGSIHLDASGRPFAVNPLLPAAMIVLGLLRANRARVTSYACVAVYLGYVVAVGAEGLGTFRFTVVVFPLLYLMVADGVGVAAKLASALVDRVARVRSRVPARHDRGSSVAAPSVSRLLAGSVAFVVTFLIAYGQLYVTVADVRPRRDINARSYVARVDMARVLCAVLARGEWIAVAPAGVIPYFCMAPTIDMLGLSDAHIARTQAERMGAGKPAHEKHDGAYVLSREPAVVVLGSGVMKKNAALLPWDRLPEANALLWGADEVWNDPRFRREYEFRQTLLPNARRWFGYFVRRKDAGASKPGTRTSPAGRPRP